MAGNGLDVSDFSEYMENMIKTVRVKYPKQASKFMQDEAKKCKKHIKNHAKTKVGKVTGNYQKHFKAGRLTYEYDGDDINILVFNDAPHAHLIEDGYKTVNGGFVPGKKVFQTGGTTFESIFAADVENELVDYLVKGIEKG